MLGFALYPVSIQTRKNSTGSTPTCKYYTCALFDLKLLVFWQLSVKYGETLMGLLTTRIYSHANIYWGTCVSICVYMNEYYDKNKNVLYSVKQNYAEYCCKGQQWPHLGVFCFSCDHQIRHPLGILNWFPIGDFQKCNVPWSNIPVVLVTETPGCTALRTLECKSFKLTGRFQKKFMLCVWWRGGSSQSDPYVGHRATLSFE